MLVGEPCHEGRLARAGCGGEQGKRQSGSSSAFSIRSASQGRSMKRGFCMYDRIASHKKIAHW